MITLMRHFDPETVFETDLERPLSKLGIDRAIAFKKKHHLDFDFALVSPAQRALDTFHHAVGTCSFEIEPLLYDLEFKDERYLLLHHKKESDQAFIQLIERLNIQLDEYKQSIVIGHDRLLQKIAYYLTKNKEARSINLRCGDCIQIDRLKNLKRLSSSN
jgi:phosphohistidine phosphatase SixA